MHAVGTPGHADVWVRKTKPGEARCEGSQPLQNQCLCMSGLMEGPHQLHREEEVEEQEEEEVEERTGR